MSCLLDTNVICELRKSGDGRINAGVAAWIETEDADRFFISAITLLELERGVLSIQRQDAPQGAWLRSWLDTRVRAEFSGRILAVDDAVATRCAHLYVPDRRNEADAIIAATALVHGLALATRDVRNFEGTGLIVVNPWQALRD